MPAAIEPDSRLGQALHSKNFDYSLVFFHHQLDHRLGEDPLRRGCLGALRSAHKCTSLGTCKSLRCFQQSLKSMSFAPQGQSHSSILSFELA